jgi:hypothetical protein
MFGKKKNRNVESAPSLTREFLRIDAAGLQQTARIASERRREDISWQAQSSDALWQEVIGPRPLLLGLSFTSSDEA